MGMGADHARLEARFGRFKVALRTIGAGPTLVLVNGAQQTTASWRGFAEHAAVRAPGRLRLVTFDFPGVGRSEIVSGEPHLSFEEQISVVTHVIEEYGDDVVSVFGASWGGLIAAAAAARLGDRVDRLLLGSFGIRPNAALVDVVAAGHRLFGEGRHEDVGRMMTEVFGGRLPEEFKERIAGQFREMDDTAVAALLRHADFVTGIGDASREVDLAAITAETLIVNGECDTIIDLGDLDEIVSSIPDCRSVVVPDAGHFLHQEVGHEDVCDLYLDFLTAPAKAGV